MKLKAPPAVAWPIALVIGLAAVATPAALPGRSCELDAATAANLGRCSSKPKVALTSFCLPATMARSAPNTPTLLQDGDHADCIQAWSRPQLAPTSDLVIVDDWANGLVQDIFLGNHSRQGVSDGGFDRIVIRGNTVRVGMPNGKVLAGARGGELKNTIVLSTPGALISNWPRREVGAKLLVAQSSVVTCGDPVKRNTDSPGTEPCR